MHRAFLRRSLVILTLKKVLVLEHEVDFRFFRIDVNEPVLQGVPQPWIMNVHLHLNGTNVRITAVIAR